MPLTFSASSEVLRCAFTTDVLLLVCFVHFATFRRKETYAMLSTGRNTDSG